MTRKLMYMMILGLLNIPVCPGQNMNPRFDRTLADSLGADEYGMKTYMLVILKTGPNRTTDQSELDSLFRGHMENINRLAQEHKLVVAGPLGKNDRNYRGIFIFDVGTTDEANNLVKSDPAVRAGIFDSEIYEWYGSAALPVYLKVHERIESQKH